MNETFDANGGAPMEEAYRAAFLIAGYLKNTLTDAERDELDEWVTASDANMRLFAEMTDEKNIEKGLKERGLYDADKAVELLKTKLAAQKPIQQTKRIPLFVYGMVACLVLLAGLFFIVPLFKQNTPQPAIVAQNDLLPGRDRATLTLPNGKQIVLDSTQGQIVQQAGFSVVNNNNILSYKGQDKEAEFHTLATPGGSQYQLLLPDGSKVWLNAASSIRFPTAFSGKERRVYLTGEAYFEVAHNAAKPFHVHVDDVDVQVLGTHFNVNAYGDEGDIKTTLLEGSVKVFNARGGLIIRPGQQAVATKDKEPFISNNIDLEEITGWKNGVFEFKDEPIESIMKEIGRWYSADVRYEGKINYHFNASIDRHVPVSKLLHLLELTNRVHFTIQDKTIIVKP